MTEHTGEHPDLSACHREPIHIPGSIQPHGVLLAVDEDMRVTRAAGDLPAMLGWTGDPLGRNLRDLLDTAGLTLPTSAGQAEYVGTLTVSGAPLDLFAHHSGDELVLELEPAPQPRKTAAQVLQELLPIVTGIACATNLTAAANIAAAAVRQITGYDRVMIYRFLDDDSGQVIAEALAEGTDSFLNHRYPASDIPRQARALYVRNPIRVIADAGYTPEPIAGGTTALDLSGALLRSVSPVHVQYLRNMGVGASASISLVRDGALWGLIACHHHAARRIVHEDREMCRRVAIALEQGIARLEEENSHREALRLTRRREELLPVIAAADSVSAGLRANIDELRRLVAADGIALVLEGEIVCSGVTPPEPAMRDLAQWALRQPTREPLATNRLSEIVPSATEWAARASGLLSAVVSREPSIGILWFRAEEIETVNWAGNPHKPTEPGSSSGLLNPRKSFEVWAETVRGSSRPWRANEQETARRIADSLAEVGRQKTLAELNRQLTEEVAEKDLLMREVHHRVQNSLQLVTSMLQLQERDFPEDGAKEQLALARDRVLSVALLHRRLWRSADLQNINLESFFEELVEGLLRTWPEEWRNQVTLEVTPLRLPAHEALLIALIVSELLTNAVKHAYAGEPGPLSLTAQELGKDRLRVTVADRGVGTTGEERTGSFGSRLVQRLVARIGAEMQVTREEPGTAVSLVVPINLNQPG